MKKTLFLATMCCLMIGANAQNCKYKVNEVDKFTGKYTKQTKFETVVSSFYTVGEFGIRKVDTSTVFVFNYVVSAYKQFDALLIAEGAQLLFLLENGETVTLKCQHQINGEKKTTIGLPPVYSCNLNNAMYPVTKSQLDLFLKHKVKSIRFYRTSGNGQEEFVDNDIKNKNKDDIQDLVKCMM